MRLWKQILCLLSFGAACALDALALKAIVGLGANPGWPPREAMLWHAGALLCGSIPALGWLSDSNWKQRATALALYLGLCAPLPLVGLAFLGAFRGLMNLPRRQVQTQDFYLGDRQVVTRVEFDETPDPRPQSVLQILSGRNMERRRRAIIALRHVDSKKALPVLQKAIQDSDEQVRLLAQTQFNKILAALELAVKKMEAELVQSARDPVQLVQLAEQYHELVHLGVSSPETETVYLDRASELLREALAKDPENRAIQFLLLKCAVKSGRLPDAKALCQSLKAGGFQPEFLAAWEAEIHFQERDWDSLREALLEMQRNKTKSSRLHSLVEFWLEPSATR